MKFVGGISVIRNIEQEIKTHDYKVLKASPVLPPCRAYVEPSMIVRLYRLYMTPYEYEIKLTFDLRDGKGTFYMKDRDSQYLFVKYPQIPLMLSKMDSVIYHFGNGLPDRVEALA